jgi:hypothetical protein
MLNHADYRLAAGMNVDVLYRDLLLPRRHRVEAEGLALSLDALARLAQDEKPGLCRGDTGGGGGVELEHGCTKAIPPSLVPRLR